MFNSPNQRQLNIPISIYESLKDRFDTFFNVSTIDVLNETSFLYVAQNINILEVNQVFTEKAFEEGLIGLLNEIRTKDDKILGEVDDLMEEVIHKDLVNVNDYYKLTKAYSYYKNRRGRGFLY